MFFISVISDLSKLLLLSFELVYLPSALSSDIYIYSFISKGTVYFLWIERFYSEQIVNNVLNYRMCYLLIFQVAHLNR